MMMEASWVTIRQRMWMLAEGAAVDVVEEGSPEVVAASLESPLSPWGGLMVAVVPLKRGRRAGVVLRMLALFCHVYIRSGA